ncbi:MAG: alpha/beta fold hydrolase [Planctomycetales bacterium]
MPASLLETRFEQLSNGRRLRVARLGAGPPLVLLHGYPENLQIWSRLAPLLAGQFEVVAFDWPGQGDSDEWPGGATTQLLAQRLLTILDELQIGHSTLVGMDMGGQPALAFAAMFPQRIARLVVMNSLVFGDAATSWEIGLLRRFGFNRFILRYSPSLVFRRAIRTFLPRGAVLDAALREDFWRAFRKPAVRRYVSKMCAGYQGALPSLPALYAQITCPTLVLWGERDKHFPVVQAQRLQAAMPNAGLNVLSGGTHWMALDRAEEIAQRIGAATSAFGVGALRTFSPRRASKD